MSSLRIVWAGVRSLVLPLMISTHTKKKTPSAFTFRLLKKKISRLNIQRQLHRHSFDCLTNNNPTNVCIKYLFDYEKRVRAHKKDTE